MTPALQYTVEAGSAMLLSLFFLRISWATRGLRWFHLNSRSEIFLVQYKFCEKCLWNLGRMALSLQTAFGSDVSAVTFPFICAVFNFLVSCSFHSTDLSPPRLNFLVLFLMLL